MIVVDSSVWVAGFRGDALVVAELSRILDADAAALTTPVRLELLSGSRKGELGRLKRVLGAVPTYEPTSLTWRRVEDWIEVGTRTGHRFGVMDLVIASTAKEHDASIWSLDEDFERMAKLRFVKLHRPKRPSHKR
jgi:predicted nucleic acid-binding protein